MAIIVQNEAGWLICHKTYLKTLYTTYGNLPNTTCPMLPKFNIFDIDSPFIMDSAAINQSASNEDDQVSRKRKRRKLRASDNDLDEYYNKIKRFIENAMDLLVEEGKQLGYFCNDPCAEILKNNSSARQMAKLFQFDNSLSHYCEENIPVLYVTKNIKVEDIYADNVNAIKVEAYKEPCSAIFSFLGQEYIVPNGAQFLLADVRHLKILTRIPGNKFDVILLDPPWCNKSVKRKKEYWTLSDDELLNFPICELAHSQCLVIVWTTNNQKQMSFVKSELFPAWLVQYCAEWHWLKVTKQGVPVHPLQSNHKKPYENLILGMRSTTGSYVSKIPNHRVIVSVPSSIHSHKPPLTEILKPYISTNPNCLEIFGRYLLPNWTSCGNEVLKLQHTKMFEVLEDECTI